VDNSSLAERSDLGHGGRTRLTKHANKLTLVGSGRRGLADMGRSGAAPVRSRCDSGGPAFRAYRGRGRTGGPKTGGMGGGVEGWAVRASGVVSLLNTYSYVRLGGISYWDWGHRVRGVLAYFLFGTHAPLVGPDAHGILTLSEGVCVPAGS
jgi:hypothetical protein